MLQQYYENRLKYLDAQKGEGKNMYPHKFFVTLSIPEYIDKYGGLSNGEHLEDVSVSLSGNFEHRYFICSIVLCNLLNFIISVFY